MCRSDFPVMKMDISVILTPQIGRADPMKVLFERTVLPENKYARFSTVTRCNL